jgi:hypothetical protein
VSDAGGHLAHQIESRDVSEPQLQGARTLFRGALSRQVANDADVSAVAVFPSFADGERYGKHFAIRASRFDLASPADDVRLAGGGITLQVAVVTRTVRLRHQHVDVLADDVRGGMTEHTLGRTAESDDFSALADHDDRIDRRVEQRFKLCGDHCRVFRASCGHFDHT